MQKALALLTIGAIALPAFVVSLWWTAIWQQLYVRLPTGGSWEQAISGRRFLKLLLLLIAIAGWVVVFTFWIQFASANLDFAGIRPLTEWAVGVLKGE
jgi:hypothetical protein